MRSGQRRSKLVVVVAAAAGLMLAGASAAIASEDTASDQAAVSDQTAALACGTGAVFIDGIRALDVLEEGDRDEVYIVDDNGAKIWPTTAAYVSMAEGQRVEVDKCVAVGSVLRLWDDDGALNPNDFMGIMTVLSEETLDRYFDNGSSRYRVGFIA